MMLLVVMTLLLLQRDLRIFMVIWRYLLPNISNTAIQQMGKNFLIHLRWHLNIFFLQDDNIVPATDNVVIEETVPLDINTEVQLENSSLTLYVLAEMEVMEENVKDLNTKVIEIRKTQADNTQTIMYAISNISVQVKQVIKQFSGTQKKTDIIQHITSLEGIQNFE